jgi:surface protein
MRGCVCRCRTHAYTCIYICICTHLYAVLLACEYGSLSSQPWIDTHGWVGMYIQYLQTPCPVRRSSHARFAKTNMRHVRAEARVRARARVCAWARPHPRRRVRALPAAAKRRVLGSQAFYSASAFNANIGAWNTASVTNLSNVCAAFGPRAHRGGLRSVGRRRMRGRCARRRRRCVSARARARAHVAMRIRVHVDGSPLDTHMCSSALELPLLPSLSMSNAHMQRPFPRCMYTRNRMRASIVRVCVCVRARARVCVCVCACVCVCLWRRAACVQTTKICQHSCEIVIAV